MAKYEIDVSEILKKQIVEADSHYDAIRKAGVKVRKLGGIRGRPPNSLKKR